MDIFIYHFHQDDIDCYAIIKPKKNGAFTPAQIKTIYNRINLNPFIIESHDDLITNKMLIFRLRIGDLGGTRFVMRTIRLFALTVFEIGLHVEDGVEYLYGLFSSPEKFESCKVLLRTLYRGEFKEKVSTLASSPGLQFELPLFAETVMCNLVKFEEYRKLLNQWLIKGIEFAPEDWNWKVLDYITQINKQLNIAPEIMQKSKKEKVPLSTREKIKALSKDVGVATTAAYLAFWLKVATRFLIMHYFKIDIGDP